MSETYELMDLEGPTLTLPLKKDVVPFPGQPRLTLGGQGKESPYTFGGVADLPSIRAAQRLARKRATWKDTAPGTSDHPEIQAAEAVHNQAREEQHNAFEAYRAARPPGQSYPPNDHPTAEAYRAAYEKVRSANYDADLVRVKHNLEPSTVSDARSSGASFSIHRPDVVEATKGFLGKFGQQKDPKTYTYRGYDYHFPDVPGETNLHAFKNSNPRITRLRATDFNPDS